jgi:hypothetical protein
MIKQRGPAQGQMMIMPREAGVLEEYLGEGLGGERGDMRIERSCGRLLRRRRRRRRRRRVWIASGKWTARPLTSSLLPPWKGVGGGGGDVARGRQKSIGQPPTPAWASGVPLAPPSKASRP